MGYCLDLGGRFKGEPPLWGPELTRVKSAGSSDQLLRLEVSPPRTYREGRATAYQLCFEPELFPKLASGESDF